MTNQDETGMDRPVAAGAAAPGTETFPEGVAACPENTAPPHTPDVSPRGERVFICWVGKADMNSAMRRDRGNPGPIRMLLERSEPFTHAILLLNGRQDVRAALTEWVAPFIPPERLELRRVGVSDLTNHDLVSGVIMGAVEYAISTWGLPADGTGIHFHLSPGTPTTHALFALLATTRFPGVRMYQTRQAAILGQQPEVLEVHLPSPERLRFGRGVESQPCSFEDDCPDGDAVPVNRGPSSSAEARRFMPRRTFPICDPAMPWPNRTPIPDTARPAADEPPAICAKLGDIYRRLEQVSQMALPVLLIGEDGCGRSRLARYIHKWSGRQGEFASMDCRQLDDATFHYELFGSPRADAQSSRRRREGVLRCASGGTLFLENVDALSLPQQTAIMRLLAPRGETVISLPAQAGLHAQEVKLRVIATASPDINDRIRVGVFSGDLYYRLSGVRVRLPAVREYAEHERMKLLLVGLLDLQHRQKRLWNFDGDAWQALIDETWAGNLREIYRTLQRICLLSPEGTSITREQILQELGQDRIGLLPEEARRLAAQCLADGGEIGPEFAICAEVDRRLAAERVARFAEEAVQESQRRVHPDCAHLMKRESPAPVLTHGYEDDEYFHREAVNPYVCPMPEIIEPGPRPLAEELDRLRRQIVTRAWELCSGDEAEMARLLGVNRRRATALMDLVQKQGYL